MKKDDLIRLYREYELLVRTFIRMAPSFPGDVDLAVKLGVASADLKFGIMQVDAMVPAAEA